MLFLFGILKSYTKWDHHGEEYTVEYTDVEQDGTKTLLVMYSSKERTLNQIQIIKKNLFLKLTTIIDYLGNVGRRLILDVQSIQDCHS